MDPCDLYADWTDIAGTSEQLDGLQDLADSIAEAWGLEGVTVEFGDVDGDDFGEYDPNTDTITIDLDGLTDPHEAIDTVFHESTHALHDQWGFSEDEMEAMHENIEVDADFLTDELLADCVSTDPAESGATATIPDIPGTIDIVGDGP
jgi:Zn-dependent membrane protease YugP